MAFWPSARKASLASPVVKKGDRRSVEKGLNTIRQIIQRRQRGLERDYGPSR